MKLSCCLAILLTFMLVCTCTYTVTAQGGCNTLSSSNGLITGTGKTGVFPNIQADPGDFRPQVGGYFISPWTLLSATQVFQNGLWCQVDSDSNGGMGSNIGDMFYSTGNGPDDFTVVPTSEPSNTNNIPFQQLKCTNQIGVIVDDDMTNFQGFLKCNTTISNLNATFTNLNINTYYWVMYTDTMFNGYTSPSVDSTMTLSIISSRDADPNINYTLSFTVSFGPPSRIVCTRDSVQLFFIRGPNPLLTREVIRSRYINSTHPDMSRVTVNLDSQPRVGATYTCTVTVEGRINIASGGYDFDPRGSGSSTVTVTVAGTPTAVTVSRIAATSVRVSWTAPSTGPALGGYEVFYQSSAGTNGSSTTTTSTELTLTGLVLEQTYSIFVVAFGPEGAPVLPSAHSNTEMITLSILPTGITLVPAATSILVSWTAPQFYTPDSYSVTISCMRLCDNEQTLSAIQAVSNEGATSHTITSLDPGNNCTVRVAAMLSGTSSESGPVYANTLSEAPNGAPVDLFESSIQSRSFTLFRGSVPCQNQRGPITGYRLRYSNGTSIVITTDLNHMLTGLTPFTSYSVQVAAVNAGGTGPYSTALTVETLQDIPGPVSDLSANPGVVQLTISWTAPSEPNGVITTYQVTHNSTGVLNYTNTSATQLTLRGLPPNTAVEYSVRAYTIIGPGENVTDQSSTTDIPSISIVSVDAVNRTAVNVSWTPVNLSVVDHYTVHYSRVGSGRRRRQTVSGTAIFLASASSGVVSGLQEGQQYQFSVSLSLSVSGQTFNSTPGATTNATTNPPISTTLLPPPSSTLPSQPTTGTTGATSSSTPTATASSVDIVPIAAAIVGILVAVIIVIIIVIVVVIVLKRRSKDKEAYAVHYVTDGPKVDTTGQYEPVSEPEYAAVTSKPFFGLFPDDATVIEGTRMEFPVKVAGTPDPQLTWYHESTRLDNDYAHEISTDGTLVIVTAEVKHAGNYRLVATNSTGTIEREFTLKIVSDVPEVESGIAVSHPVRLPELGQYVARNHASANKGFNALYNSLDSCESEHPVTVAVNATNKPLNRFNNITVYDDNHIVLQPLASRSDCQRDYINASYIHGYEKECEFIACQGPITKTVIDHWRMIWQEKCHIVVMVTNVKEDKKIKCQQYWPDSDTKDFGPFRITLTDQEIYANYTIRLLQVEVLGTSEFPRMITQYHFTSWPDHGVPEYGTPILAFHRRIRKDYKPSLGPLLVHCSAGVGRTGTFIAIDSILKQVKNEGIVDVSKVITNMRHQRMKMVQTAEQYRFIHDVILESVTCGDTQINSGDLRPSIAKLRTKDPATGKTYFQGQFEVLKQVTPNPQGTRCETALQNRAKNRSMDFLPADKHRVLLKQGHPDYINASFVNSYKHKRAFIVTQNPMENTVGDFWRMIVERNCRVIVMLNPLHENGQEVCYQYWPDSQIIKYGDYTVEVANTTKQDGYIERILTVTDKSGKSHQVTQFHIETWNSQGKCSYPQTIINVVEEVNKVQRRTDNKPIAVHCSDTVSRSGMFCAIATTIDRCKTESMVDVFQVVKAQRIQKPGLVLTVEQYEFVFEAVLTFLESFDTYANFK